jgi:hypothetical protein
LVGAILDLAGPGIIVINRDRRQQSRCAAQDFPWPIFHFKEPLMSKEVCEEIEEGLLGDTLDFLGKNIVEMPFGDETNPTNSTCRFDFVKGKQTSQGGIFYSPTLKDSSGSLINGNLLATYLPWKANTGYYVILEPDSGPDLMFTAQLDGCAVGYVRAEDGAVRVGHHNIQGTSDDNRAQKRSTSIYTNKMQMDDYYDKGTKEEGNFYLKKGNTGFVLGVRKNDGWHMYAQVLQSLYKMNMTSGKQTELQTVVGAKEF